MILMRSLILIFTALFAVPVSAGTLWAVNGGGYKYSSPGQACEQAMQSWKAYWESTHGNEVDNYRLVSNSGKKNSFGCEIHMRHWGSEEFFWARKYTVKTTNEQDYKLNSEEGTSSCNGEGNPCDVVTGRKTEKFLDLIVGKLVFSRFYDSGSNDVGSRLGGFWKHSLEYRLNRITRFTNSPVFGTYAPVKKRSGEPSPQPTEESACLTGWAEIKNSFRRGTLSFADAEWTGGYCNIVDVSGDILAQLGVGGASSDAATIMGFTMGGTVEVSSPDGSTYQFESVNGEYSEVSGKNVMLSQEGSVMTFTTESGLINKFQNELLVSQTLGDGSVISIARDGQGRIFEISDLFGHKLTLNYGENNQLLSLSTSEGIIQYGYDENYNLSIVTYEDGGSIIYHYENANYPNHLTGYTDENGVRFASWTYDEEGRAISSEHAGGVERVNLEYLADQTVVTDALGAQRVYHLDSLGGQWVVTHVSGDRCSDCNNATAKTRDYDDKGRLSSKTDWEGNTTTYTYNDLGREVSRTEAFGTPEARTTLTEWDSDRPLITKLTETGRLITMTYDDDGRLLTRSVEDTVNTSLPLQTTTMEYNLMGLLVSIDGPRTDLSDLTQLTYDESGNLTSVINALGQTKSYGNYTPRNLPGEIVDENGVITSMTYTPRGWLETVTHKAPIGSLESDAVTTFSYDGVGQLVSVTEPGGGVMQYVYDDARRLVAIENALGERVEYTLDLMGNRLSQTVKNSTQEIVYLQNSMYDKLSQLLSVISPLGDEISYEYNANGQQNKFIDGLGQTWVKSYDALRRLVKETDPELFDVTYTYDALDNIASVTDQRGLTTTYTYDAFGNRLTEQSPDTGLTEFGYDAAGNRIYRKDAKGVEVNYTYDALNRLIATTYPASIEENVTYEYDQDAECTYGVGRLSGVFDAESILQYRYDSQGNLAQKISQIESYSYAISYAYDASNRLVGLVYPNGREVNYIRDAAGQVQEVRTRENAGGSWVLLASSVTHYPFGAVESFTYGNGLTQTFEYDQAYRLISQAAPSVLERSYGYDSNQNITNITDDLNAARTQNFSYDPLDRLGQASGNYGTQSFEYDSVGNRTSWIRSLSSQDNTQNYVYSATSNQLDQVVKSENSVNSHRNLQYDAAGQIVQDVRFDGTTFDLKYNKANRLYGIDKNQVATTSYVLNALGQRIAKVSSDPNQDKHYHYEQMGRLIAVSDLAAGTMVSYVYLGDQRIAQIQDTVAAYDAETCWGDSDRDGLDDQWEMHFFGDLSQDGTGDADGDNFLDSEEFAQGSSPTEITADTDTLPDSWELQYFGSLGYSESGDFDGDGYTNGQEYLDGTDPSDASSAASETADDDSDGMLDRWEFRYFGTLGRDGAEDFDGDGVSDAQEFADQTDPADIGSFNVSSQRIFDRHPWMIIIL